VTLVLELIMEPLCQVFTVAERIMARQDVVSRTIPDRQIDGHLLQLTAIQNAVELVTLDHLVMGVAEAVIIKHILVVLHVSAFDLELHLPQFVTQVHELNISVGRGESVSSRRLATRREVVEVREFQGLNVIAEMMLDDHTLQDEHDGGRADLDREVFHNDLHRFGEGLMIDAADRRDEFAIGFHAKFGWAQV
jgi:hypothetical protein